MSAEPATLTPDGADEIRIGGKKVFVLFFKEPHVELNIDCNECNGVAYLKISMTRQQYDDWLHRVERGKHVQDIFPELEACVREALITGTTPAEWQEMLGTPKKKRYKVADLKKLGYVFDEDFNQE